MKTLDVEQINRLQTQQEALVQTARAGAQLASLVRGAIRGCTPTTDPDGRLEKMLVGFLEFAGFELPLAELRKKAPPQTLP